MSDDFKQTMISAVFERRAIWDQRHAGHHNRFKLDKLWKEVARKCETNTNDVKKKWKTLRQQFKEKWEKLPRPTTGNPAPEESVEWPYFQSMLFLRENFEPRTTSGNLNSSETVSETEENIENISDSEEADNPSTPISETSPSISNTQLPSCSVTPSSSTAPDSLGYRKRARPTDVIGSQIVEIEKEKLRMRKEKELQSSNKHDEDVAFFTSLLPHVRRMDPINKMTFRIEVQKLVMERAYGVGYGSLMSKDTNKHNPPAEGGENLLRHTSAPPSIFETHRGSPHVSSMIPAYSSVYSTSIFPQPHFTEIGVPSTLRSHNSPGESVNSFQANVMGGGPEYNEPQGMQGTFMMDKNKN